MTKNPGTAPREFLRQDLYVVKELVAAASNLLNGFHSVWDTVLPDVPVLFL